MALWGGSIKSIEILTFWVSIIFSITCMIFYLVNKFSYKNHDCYSDYNNLKSTLLHAVSDIAMVVTFVFIGLLIVNFIIDIAVGPEPLIPDGFIILYYTNCSTNWSYTRMRRYDL